MTYLQILNLIKDTALAQPNVNSVVREFLDLNREDAKYSAVVIQDRDGSRDRIVEQDYVTYTWHLGYVDRLTYDESNRDDIISTGINIINNIVNTIRNTWFPELEVSIVDRINTFDQRFTAQCAGVYVVLAVNAQVSDCVDSESTDLYDTYDAKITANGVYHFVPSGRPVDEINITVDVAGKEEVSLTDTVTMNGTHTYIPEEDTVYKDVELTVDVHPTERLVQTYTTNGVKTITGEFNGGEITVDVDTDTVWGKITGNITDQTDLIDYVTGKDNDIKTWVESQSYLTSLSLNGYVQETNLKTINGESLVGKGDIVIQTTAENIECGPVSNSLFNFSNVNEGLIQITDSVEEINNTKENKKPVFYIDVDFDGPSVMTSYADYMSIGAQIKQLGADNVVLYVRDRSGYVCMPDLIEVVSQNYMTITGWAYTNNYRIYNNSSSILISSNSFVGYTQLNNNINDVKTWVVNQKYAKKTDIPDVSGYVQESNLKTINGESIVGSGDITIQATGGVTEEWLQTNLKTINGESLIGGGNLAVQSPIEIGINLDSAQLLGITYDNYKALVNEYADDGGYTRKLMIFLESETAVRGYSTYPSDVEYCPDGTIEIGGYYLDDRDENNKRLVYYRIKDNDAAQKVEISFTPVSSGGDIPSLDGYATQEWVESKGYLTEHQSLADYALKSEIPDVSGYALKSEVPSLTGYATETWVESKGYLTEHQSLDGYALKSEIPSLTGYATQTYVDDKIGQIDTLLDQMLG